MGAAAAMLLLAGTAAFAAQDPNDPGAQDSIIIDMACAMEFGADSVKVTVVTVNDNETMVAYIPLFYDSPGDYWKIDTAWFVSDRWKIVPIKGFSDRFSENPDTAKYLIFVQAMFAPIPPGRDSIATITFTKNPNSVANPGPLTIGYTTVTPSFCPPEFLTAGKPAAEYFPALDVHYPCNCSMIGDCDNSGTINPVDVVVLCQYSMMLGDAPPSDPYCPIVNRGDFDCDDQVTFSDVVQLVNFVYHANAVPPCNPCSWEGDTIPPAAVTDLAIAEIGPGALTLGWSAPGDDDNLGTAAQYDIRYSTEPITDENWNSALPVANKPAPRPAGSYQTVVVPRLAAGSTYYFALKSLDDARLISPISNGVSGSPEADFAVNFPDMYLEILIRARFERPVGALYASELLTVTELFTYSDHCGMADLSGLEYCANLQTLFITGCEINGLNPLADLSRLRCLNLASNRITDITPLSNLENLEWLILPYNQIANLGPLLGNPGLGQGDLLLVGNNPLSSYSVEVCIPTLRERGVKVGY